MGRELKRVPLDFEWPLGMIWKGYLNPYKYQECKSCEGSGYNKETKKIADDWYSIDNVEWIKLENGRRYNNFAWQNHLTEYEVNALIKEDRLWDFTRVPITDEQRKIVKKKIADGGNSWLPFNNGYTPTPEEVNNWNRQGRIDGHDSINRIICVKARAERLGVYGNCDVCNGEGIIFANDEIKNLHETWKSFDPPMGEGYQLWETTSEGSPKSPVFNTLEKLCEWCENNATTFGSSKASKQEWLSMLDDGFICHKEGNLVFI